MRGEVLLKKDKNDNKTNKEYFYQTWKEVWKMEIGKTSREIIGKKEDLFYELFEESYNFAKKEKSENKRKNFNNKGLFFLVLIAGILAYVVLDVLEFFWSESITFVDKTEVLLAVFFLALIVGKWLDVKKYQETWVRHSQLEHLLEKEMLSFLYRIEPYQKNNRVYVFMERIIEIWDANEVKFVQNMENKEKNLLEIFDYIKKKE